MLQISPEKILVMPEKSDLPGKIIRRWRRRLIHEHAQIDRGEVAHRHLVGGRVFDDLRAQVGALDSAQILLV